VSHGNGIITHVTNVSIVPQFSAGLSILSRLPPDSELATNMSNSAISLLYNTIPHPPAAFLGPVHSYRQADGGGNNLQYPDCGRAGTPYARSVQGKWCTPRSSLPDAGLVFDTILKARDVSTWVFISRPQIDELNIYSTKPTPAATQASPSHSLP